MPKMHSGKKVAGKILIGAYISDLMKWWQFLKVDIFIIYIWNTVFQQKIDQFSENMSSLERFFTQLEFGTNHEFLAQSV